MKNPVLRLFLSVIISLMLFLVVISYAHRVFAQGEQIDTSHITAVIDVHSKSRFNFTNSVVFARGETVDFYGYVDGYTQLENDSQAIFTVTITDPKKLTIFHQQFLAEEKGGQDIITFSYEIPENAPFGKYEVGFIVEKQGHKTISQDTSDPNVSYRPGIFAVSWTEQDVIDVSDKYRLEIIKPNQDDMPMKFGSWFDAEARLCPTPMNIASDHIYYDTASGETFSYEGQPVLILTSTTVPIDEVQARAVSRSYTGLQTADGCNNTFTTSTSTVLAASGKWSLSLTATWLDRNDPDHAYRVRSEPLIFDVAGTLYRTNNITTINLDDQKYPNALPMDLSVDGRSILFTYQRFGEAAKLGILHLDAIGNETEGLERAITDFGNLTVAVDATNPESYQSLSQARFGTDTDNPSIYFVLDSGAYRYKIDESPSPDNISINSAERLSNINNHIDILPDGKIVYFSSGKLMVSQPGGQNAEEIAVIKDLPPYYFDISSDGKKVLYTKILKVEYYNTESVIAYYDIETGKEHIIPNIKITCGGGAQWAPNNYNFIFDDDLCGRAPGGGLIMSDINGGFQDPIVPLSDDNPDHYVFSPDGHSVVIGFGGYREGQARDYMGPPADFYIMTLARPVPEFSLPTIIPIIGVATLVGITLIRILRLQYPAK